jgi:hypothetical protein
MATKKAPSPKKKTENPATVRQQLVNELGSLRGQFHDITARYQANVEALLVASINGLSVISTDDLSGCAANKHELQKLVESIKELKLKPQKGRLKDIRRIDKLVAAIAEQLGQG